ncbi:MAG: hypothetical protein JRJ79_18135, partial [Deltaproteobacteria bacterium]|nr:hypothetical protein [Deltaproteobacteria bacterium]
MDIATILGVISAFGLVIIAIFMGGGIQLFINIPALMIVVGGTLGIAIFMGGGIQLFINIPSLMIVVGGTLGATMINYPLKEVFGVLNVVKKALFTRNIPVDEIIKRFLGFAKISRKEGIL